MEGLDAALEVVAVAGGRVPIKRFEGFGLLNLGQLQTAPLLDFGLDMGLIKSPQLRAALVTAVDRGYLSYDTVTLGLTTLGEERLRTQGLIPADESAAALLELDDSEFVARAREALATA